MGELCEDVAWIEARGIRTDVFTNGTGVCSVRLYHPASGITVTREGRGMIRTRHEAVQEMREKLGEAVSPGGGDSPATLVAEWRNLGERPASTPFQSGYRAALRKCADELGYALRGNM
jgi:hypothetical protein